VAGRRAEAATEAEVEAELAAPNYPRIMVKVAAVARRSDR